MLEIVKRLHSLPACRHFAPHQSARPRLSPLKRFLMRAFGRPKGLVGRLGGIVMAWSNRGIATRTVELVNIEPSDRVLEIGFGPGAGIQLLAERAILGQIAGIDSSEEMVEQATARNAAAVESGRVELQVGSVERLPFANEAFDKALAINSVQIWSDPLAGLREIRRVLKPGGTIALGFTSWSGQSTEGLIDIVAAAGFADAHMLYLGREFWVFAVRPDATRSTCSLTKLTIQNDGETS